MAPGKGQAGAGNVELITTLYETVEREMDKDQGGIFDALSVEKLKEFVQDADIANQVNAWLADLDPKKIGEAALGEVAKKLTVEVGKILVVEIIKLIPVPSPDKIVTLLQKTYDGVKFFFEAIKKAEKIAGEINNVATAVAGLQAGTGPAVVFPRSTVSGIWIWWTPGLVSSRWVQTIFLSRVISVRFTSFGPAWWLGNGPMVIRKVIVCVPSPDKRLAGAGQ